MQTGLQRLLQNPIRWLGKARAALVTNPTAILPNLEHAADAMAEHPDINLVQLMGPEHGIRGEAQYMVDVRDTKDPKTGLPVVSLYGKTFASLAPSPERLKDIEIIIFDIQDVGARYYTYAATMALCMQAAAKASIRMLVLDRPNPIGGALIEGGGLTPGLENFCALYPVPQRHGMTVGELARLYNTTFGIGCELDVVSCEGWRRQLYFDQLELPWVMPSPNMPTLDTALVYPGMCLLEGTNESEGRGTTRPFELFGAPFIEPYTLASELRSLNLPGVQFRPCGFQPSFDKFTQQVCSGLQLHITHRQEFRPYRTGLAVIWACRKLWPEQFKWRQEPYEFRDDALAIDLLTGNAKVRESIDAGEDFATVLAAALSGTKAYTNGRADALLY